MVRHIVAWNFKEGFTDIENFENATRVKNDLENLRDIIPNVIDIEVKIDLVNTSTRKIMLDSLFECDDDLAIYQVHPEHVKVVEFIKNVFTDRVCLDFYE